MSVLSDIRAKGVGVLTSKGGESLTPKGGAEISAVVNRKVSKIRDAVSMADGGSPNFNVLGMTEIEILRSVIAQPVAGAVFTDAFKFNHRVRYVTMTDITWVLYCMPSQSV